MTGDGLSDLVRIRNGEVCYWPNLGYGRFGAKVTMDHAPWFDDADLFDQRRIRLADTDGSGTTDILYLAAIGVADLSERDGQRLERRRDARRVSARRQSRCGHGSGFSRPRHGLSGLVVAAAGRLWTAVRYVDLMCGRKPHLLDRVVNNLGARDAHRLRLFD